MAYLWYQLANGPAPWEDAVSFSSNTPSNSYTSFQSGFNSSYSSTSGAISAGYTNNASVSSKSINGLNEASGYTFLSSTSSGTSIPSINVTYFKQYLYSSSSTSNLNGALVGDSVIYTQSYTYHGYSSATEVYQYSTTSAGGFSEGSFGSSSSSTFSLARVTDVYVSGYHEEPYNAYRFVQTTDSSQRSYPVSTVLTDDTITYVSTTIDSSWDTFTCASYLYVIGAGVSSVADFDTYYLYEKHKIPVVSAASNEFLRVCTAASSVICGLDDIYGPTCISTTLSSAILGGVVYGSPYSDYSVTRTVIPYDYQTASTVYTISVNTTATITEQDWNGWIGGTYSSTKSVTLDGVTTQALSSTTYITVLAAAQTKTGYVGATTQITQTFFVDYAISQTITGINDNGESQIYAIQIPGKSKVFKTYIDYWGQFGATYTTYRSPIGTVFNGGSADLTRLNRVGGFQSPNSIGSTANNGRLLTANYNVFIGNELSVGARDSIYSPCARLSTAVTSDSSYSFTSSSDGKWSFTAASTSLSGKATNIVTVSFTNSIGIDSVGDKFHSFRDISYNTRFTLAGGAHGRTGADQAVTLSAGYGYCYTYGDSSSTTSAKVILTNSCATAALGSSIIAVETFRAGLADPSLQPGLPTARVFTYSAP